MMRIPMTITDYFNSPMICWPFRLFDICLETYGGCALVVTSAERAHHLRHRPVYISAAIHGGGPNLAGYGLNLSPYIRWKDHTESYARYIAPELFARAGVTPKDADVAEIYDEMTIATIIQLEDFGFCQKGEGGPLVEEGRTAIGGDIPVNIHGGLLSEGYLHGLNHVVEAVSQLRGDAGPWQVKNAEVALTCGMGGPTGSALILRRG